MVEKIHDEHLNALCASLGIDIMGSTLDAISELMNFSLQCLGGIRILFEHLENENKTQCLLNVDGGTTKYSALNEGYWAMKMSFSNAVKRYMDRIVLSEEPHNLDPSRHILESFPNATTIGSREWLSSHWAALGDPGEHPFCLNYDGPCLTENADNEFDKRVFVMKRLGNVMPDCFKEVDKEGRSVLHIAARLDSVKLFETALECCRQFNGKSIHDANSNGALPLHNAARFCNCLSVYERVRDEFPGAVEQLNNDEMFPLHWAAAKNRNVSIVKDLIERYPIGIKSPNHEGYLPLHCAGQNNCLDVVRLIHDAYPPAAKVPDFEGGLPLHHACCFNKGNVEVARFICEAYPSALTTPQPNGVTPMHLATSQNDSVELLQLILDKYPQATTLKDDEGWLPIDCLLEETKKRMSSALLDCVRLLSKANSSVVSRKVPLEENIISRIILHGNPFTDQQLYKRLNWMARRQGLLVVINLSNDQHDYNYEALDIYLRKSFALDYLMRDHHSRESIDVYVSRCVANEITHMKLLRRLCRQFMGSNSNGRVPSGILQKIIKMI
jgi:ankyrin repeat protein